MAAVAYVRDFVTNLSPAEICQLFYTLSAATVLAVAAVPDAAQRLLTQYGARSSHDTPASAAGETREGTNRGLDDINRGAFFHLVSGLTSIGMIPHSWFIHFYILSISCTVYWAVQFVYHGTVFEFIARKQLSKSTPSMALEQVVLVWFCMGLQGARRLYEHLVVLQSSSSRMWIVHWLLGMLSTYARVYQSGLKELCSGSDCPDIGLPRPKVMIASFVFFVAWLMQYRCHRYLAGLKKYSLPDNGLFSYLVCPHYTCECLLYLSLAVMAAPQGQLYNRTVICAMLFVMINLGVTAHGTKSWYGEKFGSDRVQGKWRMIPIIF
ncbi:hypothetical protein RRF57_003603 [Xylaria bambusicola]|uniref:Polyprenal reductase n=1 Tax=Xylaria bambusicola TaxID=326684 RepID=A0AAN7UHR0_9PEZI